jgi:hypothetical protein
MKKSLFVIFIFILLGLSIFIIYPLVTFLSIQGEVKDAILQDELIGIVVNVAEAGPCHSKVKLVCINDTFSFIGCNCNHKEFWNYLDLGDSIKKEKGKFDILIKKIDSSKVFEYPQCIE